jgi:hypothetical protein
VSQPRADLMAVHNALSHLLFAVRKSLEDVPGLWGIECRYREGVYLSVEIEVTSSKGQQMVVDRLMHGVLWGEYDYRFSLSYPTLYEDGERRVISAYPNLTATRR